MGYLMSNITDKIDGWNLCQVAENDGQFSGMWFAARSIGKEWCDYLGAFYEEHEYIHADGIVRKSTKNGESWGGYFTTREEVLAAIKKVNGQ